MPDEVTLLLNRWSEGDREALDRLLPLVYGELRRIAGGQVRRERREQTLQATALVHEAFLRLVEQREVRWQSRGHFYAIAAQVMRRLLVDYARRRAALKRGGGQRADGDVEEAAAEAPGVDLVRLGDALDRLAGLDAGQARIVELRYFAGLTIEETAEAVGSAPATVKREWSLARAWLRRELEAEA